MPPIEPERDVRGGYAPIGAGEQMVPRPFDGGCGFSWGRKTRRIVQVLVALVLTWPNGDANIKGALVLQQ